MRNLILPLVIFFVIIAAYSCDNYSDTSLKSRALSVNVQSINSPEVLGRILFYDKNLSINGSVACSSCHKQELAFADNKQFSIGFENVLTNRNSPPIQNLSEGFLSLDGTDFNNFNDFSNNNDRVIGSLFWDGRENSLKEMVLKPIVNHQEMGIKNLDDMVERLKRSDFYSVGFANVYGQSDFNIDHIADALAKFTGSITSFETELDDHFRSGASLSALAENGKNLFFDKYQCNSCHQVGSPTGYQFNSGGAFLNIGLDQIYEDEGVMAITGEQQDAGKFKTPSLRNIELTAPYMHDGRFSTLEEVIQHYSIGISNNENLDSRLKDSDGNPNVFAISEQETKSIIAFLRTLTDHNMVSNPVWSDPFTYN
jgi:cytochrome c peroxidase